MVSSIDGMSRVSPDTASPPALQQRGGAPPATVAVQLPQSRDAISSGTRDETGGFIGSRTRRQRRHSRRMAPGQDRAPTLAQNHMPAALESSNPRPGLPLENHQLHNGIAPPKKTQNMQRPNTWYGVLLSFRGAQGPAFFWQQGSPKAAGICGSYCCIHSLVKGERRNSGINGRLVLHQPTAAASRPPQHCHATAGRADAQPA